MTLVKTVIYICLALSFSFCIFGEELYKSPKIKLHPVKGQTAEVEKEQWQNATYKIEGGEIVINEDKSTERTPSSIKKNKKKPQIQQWMWNQKSK